MTKYYQFNIKKQTGKALKRKLYKNFQFDSEGMITFLQVTITKVSDKHRIPQSVRLDFYLTDVHGQFLDDKTQYTELMLFPPESVHYSIRRSEFDKVVKKHVSSIAKVLA